MDTQKPVFEEVWEKYKGFVYRLLRERYQPAMTGMDIDDLAQEVAIRVWRGWDKFNGGNIFGWLDTVTRNTVIDVLRRRGVRRRSGAEEFTDLIEAAESVVDEAAEAAYQVEETKEFAAQVLSTLTPREAVIFKVVYMEERRYQDAGDMLGISQPTVCRVIKEVRANIRKKHRDLVEQYAHA